jgi:hypothetical protein
MSGREKDPISGTFKSGQLEIILIFIKARVCYMG